MPEFPKGLDPTEFTVRMMEIALGIIQAGGMVVAGLVHDVPVAMATVKQNDDGNLLFPHTVWFPEATARNKLELGLKLFMELKKNHTVLVPARTPRGEKSADVRYFEHLCNYGVLRRVGTLRDYFGWADNAVLFQAVNERAEQRHTERK